jgi:dTDP-4-dehydrorhamnose reductase
MFMKVLVTGGAGQLGREFVRQLGAQAAPLDLPAFNVAERSAVRRVMRDLRPDAVINCAAYTEVDKAEAEPQACAAVNADAVACLAQACQQANCLLVQLSTDYVFGSDAQRTTPYQETDEPGPQGVYARTKLSGEENAALCRRHFVVRTCGLYGQSPRRNNFVETMLRLGGQGKPVRVIGDQQCTPTFVRHVARAIVFLLSSTAYGTYHIVNSGATSWHDFAVEIFRQANMDVRVERITTAQYGAAAPRPRYSVLDTSKYRALGGPPLPSWRDALQEYLATRR